MVIQTFTVDPSGLDSILTTDGDIAIRAAGVVTRLGVGTANQLLGVSGGLPAWEDRPSTTYIPLGMDITGAPFTP